MKVPVVNAFKKLVEQFRGSENSILAMIKTVITISIASLIIISVIIAGFHSIQNDERQKLAKQQSQLMTHVNKIDTLVQQSEHYFQDITINYNSNANDKWLEELHNEFEFLYQAIDDQDIATIARKMENIDALKTINSSKDWLKRYNKVSQDIENKTTLNLIYKHITSLEREITSVEGKYNLGMARYRRMLQKQNTILTKELSEQVIDFSYSSRQIGSFKTSLNDLKQNIDKIAIEYKKDNLPDIRENMLLPAFTKLNHLLDGKKSFDLDIPVFKVTLQLIGQELFGHNFNLFNIVENKDQLNGGFYQTKLEYLTLKKENKQLQFEISTLLGEYEKNVLQITQKANNLLNSSMHKIGKSLTKTEHTILTLSALFAIGLIFLGTKVLQRVHLQLEVIVNARKRMGQILTNMWDGLLIINNNGNVIQSNPAVERIFDKQIAEHTNVSDLIPELSNYEIEDMYTTNVPFEMSAINENGDFVPVELTVSLIDSSNELTEYAIFIRDISGTKRLDEAKKANELKSTFLANMSHEIRTPMNGVIGTVQLMERTKLDNQQKKYINRINSSSYTLLEIINDILDFSKIESGKLAIEKININLDDILGRVADVNAVKAEEKKVEFIYSIAKDVPRKLVGDGVRITQILTNLASNAIKFTSEGEIVLNISVESKMKNEVELLFSVRDTGIGMTEKQVSKLFQDFVQADSSTTRKFGGTGLGLSISKKLVELMGGEIGVKSQDGMGSTFWFRLPFIVQEDQKDSKKHNYKNMHMLVVDDNETALNSLKEQLEMFSIDVDTAEDGQTAIKKIQSMQQYNPYKLVFMDWKMPGLNGIETIKKIKEIEQIKVKPKFVMVTAYGKEDIKEAKNCELLNAFINKPTTPSIVYDTIVEVFQDDESADLEINISSSGEDLSGFNVLLVEDNLVNQEVAIELLEDKGMIVTLAENGEEAIDKAAKQKFDIILMDMQMPVMDGIQATKILRSQKRYDTIPIIALTANAMADDIQKCNDVGMNDHISKPINIDMLYSVIAKWVNPQANNMAPQKVINTANKQIIMPNGEELPQIDGINFDEALKRINGKESLFIKMLTKFYQHQNSSMDEIQESWDNKSYDEAVLVAHSLKGVSGNIGADLLHIEAAELEMILKNKEDDKFVDSFNKTKKSFDMIMQELEKIFGKEKKDVSQNNNLEIPSDINFNLLNKQFESLSELLNNDERDSIHLLNEIEKEYPFMTGFKEFNEIKEFAESYDFDEAASALEKLTTLLKKENGNG